MGEKAVMILVTTGARDDAERIGEALVVEHLAASCSVIPTVHSFYYWDGQLQREHEALLIIKTLESRAAAVQDFVRGHHEYELPEIIQVPIEGGSSAYLAWLEKQVAGGGAPDSPSRLRTGKG
jgi:periplasmic divalent cation tolerance protein